MTFVVMGMRELSPEIKLNYFSVCALVAYLILPILNRGLPSILRVVAICVLVTLYLLTLCMIDRSGAIETLVVMVLTIGFVTLCYFGSAQTVSLPQYIFINYLFWIPLLFIYNRQYVSDRIFRRFLSKLIFILFSITALTTLIGLSTDPMAARNLATGLTEEYGLRSYSIRNIGGYGFIYSLVIMIPLLVGAWRTSCIRKSYVAFALILAVACIFRSQYSTALALTVVALSTIFIGKQFTSLRLCVFLLCEIAALLVLVNLLPIFINILSGLGAEASFLAYRLSDSLNTISTDGFLGLDRVQRAEMSWSIFANNILTGNLFSPMMKELGAHSTLLDLLASMGLLAVPFISFFMIAVTGRLIKRFTATEIKPYAVATFVLFCILGIINTVLSSFTIPVVLFLLPLGLLQDDPQIAHLNWRSLQ